MDCNSFFFGWRRFNLWIRGNDRYNFGCLILSSRRARSVPKKPKGWFVWSSGLCRIVDTSHAFLSPDVKLIWNTPSKGLSSQKRLRKRLSLFLASLYFLTIFPFGCCQTSFHYEFRFSSFNFLRKGKKKVSEIILSVYQNQKNLIRFRALNLVFTGIAS